MSYVVLYAGRPIGELTRDELHAALAASAEEVRALYEELARLRKHIDWKSYLLDPERAK